MRDLSGEDLGTMEIIQGILFKNNFRHLAGWLGDLIAEAEMEPIRCGPSDCTAGITHTDKLSMSNKIELLKMAHGSAMTSGYYADISGVYDMLVKIVTEPQGKEE